MGDPVRRRRQVRRRGRDGLERGAEGERQGEQRAMQVEGRQRVAARHHRDAGDAGGERHQRLLDLQHHLAADNQRHVAQELDAVAQALLGVQQDGPAGERLAAPLRLGEVARRQVADTPARLVLVPAGREVAAQELEHALAGRRHGVVGIERARLAKAREGLVHAVEVLEREAEVEVGDGKARRQRDGPAACGFGVRRMADGAQCVPQIGIGLGVVGLELGPAAKMPGRFLEPPQLAQRGAEVVVRLVMIGPQRQHAAIARLRLGVAPGFPQEIAELVMGLDEIRIEAEGLPERRLGVLVAAHGQQGKAQAVAAIGPGRGQRARALDMRHGRLRVAGAQRHDAAQVPGPGMALVEGKQLAARTAA
jgi:hypothetical protein